MSTPAQARQGVAEAVRLDVALIQAHGQRHPQSAKRSVIHTSNYNILSIMCTLAQARQGVAEAVRLDAKR